MDKGIIVFGSDHAGFSLKEFLKDRLSLAGFSIEDCGTFSDDRTDYPDFAHKVASVISKDPAKTGLLICGSANGVAMSANKHSGIRCAICWNEEIASLAKQHNNANIIAIPARFVDKNEAVNISMRFMESIFEGGRHEQRVSKIDCQ